MKTIRLVSLVMLGMAITLGSCSGDDGKDGLPGLKGDTGDTGLAGADGLACWDLDQDGVKDALEDINNDGKWDALDCQGADGNPGTPGADGQDKPNIDFYFQDGFKAYDGTQDKQISNLGETTNTETSAIGFVGMDEANGTHTVIRFDGISNSIKNALVEAGQNCSESFNMNQAILYIYVDEFQTDATSMYIHLGFYNSLDPSFDQFSATWTNANDLAGWGGGAGGFSSQWVGPFPETDNYSIAYPFSGTSTSKPGWFAIPLPRDIVNEWICTVDANKGIRLRISGDGGTFGSIIFASSDNVIEDIRPVLVIQTEKIDLGAKSATTNTKPKDWDSMTYEEQMAPLLDFLENKNN